MESKPGSCVPAGDGKSISEDGKCLVCRGDLCVIEKQPHLSRDWCWCSFCGNTMSAVEGVTMAQWGSVDADCELDGVCASGCTAPVVVTDPEPLCARCAERMRV